MPNGTLHPVYSRSGDDAQIGWKVKWRENDSQHSRSFDLKQKSLAKKFLAHVRAKTAVGSSLAVTADPTTLGKFTEDRWDATITGLAPSAKGTYTSIRDAWVVPALGRKRLDLINDADVTALYQHALDEGLAESSVKMIRTVLNRTYLQAIKDKRVVSNPAAGVKIPVPETVHEVDEDTEIRPEDIISAWAVASVLHQLPVHYRNYLLFQAGTGVRPGEGAGLLIGDADTKELSLRIKASLSAAPSKFNPNEESRYRKATKNKSSNRLIPMPPALVPIIEAAAGDRPATEPLFVGPQGGALNASYLNRKWFAPLTEDITGTRYTLHDLRHFAASVMIRASVPLPLISRMLGHASSAITAQVYTHFFADDLTMVAQVLSDATTGIIDDLDAADADDVLGQDEGDQT